MNRRLRSECVYFPVHTLPCRRPWCWQARVLRVLWSCSPCSAEPLDGQPACADRVGGWHRIRVDSRGDGGLAPGGQLGIRRQATLDQGQRDEPVIDVVDDGAQPAHRAKIIE